MDDFDIKQLVRESSELIFVKFDNFDRGHGSYVGRNVLNFICAQIQTLHIGKVLAKLVINNLNTVAAEVEAYYAIKTI